MPRGSEKPNEFKRYRQTLKALYLAAVGAGVLLLAASVLMELYFRPVVKLPGPILSAANPDPENLLRCHDDVVSLYEDLAGVPIRLLSLPLEHKRDEVLPRWEEFSKAWLARWERVNAWCRFSELADSHLGEAYNRMAEIHGDLYTMRLKYHSLLIRFDGELAGELARLKSGLESSRNLLSISQGAGDERAR